MAGIYGSGGGNGGSDDNQRAYEQSVVNRLLLLEETSPWIGDDPILKQQMAMSPIPTVQLAKHGAQVAGMMNMDALRSKIGNLPAATQRAMYAQLSKTQQSALASLGYNGPEARTDDDSGWFDDVIGFGGSVIGAAVGGLSTVTGGLSDKAFQGLAWLGDQPAHLYRTIRTLDIEDQWAGALGALAGGLGVALAPFTGGLSLGVTAGLIGTGALIGGNIAGGVSASLTTGTDWWDSFSNSWDGEKTFQPQAQKRARMLLGNNAGLANLAKDLAIEGGIDQLALSFAGTRDATEGNAMLASVQRVVDSIADPSDPRYKNLLAGVAKIAQDPAFVEAVQTLQDGKISFGRDLANTVGLDPGSTLYNVTSGAVDALWLVTMDPLMMGMGKAKALRATRYAVPVVEAEAAKWLRTLASTDRAVGRRFDQIAAAVETSQFDRLKTFAPETMSMWDDLVRYRQEIGAGAGAAKTFGREQLLDFYEKGGGLASILQGKSLTKGDTAMMIAGRSRASVPWARVKDWGRATIDMADDNRITAQQMRDVAKNVDEADYAQAFAQRVEQRTLRPEVVTAGMGFSPVGASRETSRYARTQAFMNTLDQIPGVNRIERQFGALLGTNVRMVPRKDRVLLQGDKAAMEIDKALDLGRFGIKSDVVNAWRGFILGQSNPALRGAAIEAYIGTMLDAGGIGSLKAGRELAEEFMLKQHQAFALGGIDSLTVGGLKRNIGVLPVADQAYELAIPNLTELRKAMQAGSFLKYVLNVGESPMIAQRIDKIWKPAVLLRIGFIPRAAGEELLAHLARIGFSTYLASFAERSVAEGKLASAEFRQQFLNGGDLLAVKGGFSRSFEHFESVAHLRPLHRMAAEWNYGRPVQKIIEGYSTMLRGMLEHGVLPTAMVERMSPRTRQLVLGNERKMRSILLRGADLDTVRAAGLFEGYFAASLADEVSARNAGLLDLGTHGEITTVKVEDPKRRGVYIDTPMVMDRSRYAYAVNGAKDGRFAVAYKHTVDHAMQDPIVTAALGSVLPRIRPSSVSEAHAWHLWGSYNDLNGTPILKNLVSLGMSGKPLTDTAIETWLEKAAATVDEDTLQQLRNWMPGHGSTANDVLDAIERSGIDAGGEAVASARKILTELDELNYNERGWAGLFLNHRVDVPKEMTYWLTADEASAQVNDIIRSGMLHPDHQDFLRQSWHNIADPSGVPVARPLDMPRSYHPALHESNARRFPTALRADPEIASALAAGVSPREAVQTVMKARYRALPTLTHRGPDDLVKADHWIDQFTQRWVEEGNIGEYVSDALRGVEDRVVFVGDTAVYDPQLADNLAKVLHSFVDPSGTPALNNGAAFMQTPRGMADHYIREPLLVNGKAEMVPRGVEAREVAPGVFVHGTTVEAAAGEWAGVVQQRLNQVLREDVRTVLTPKREGVSRVIDNKGTKTVRPMAVNDPVIPQEGVEYWLNYGEKDARLISHTDPNEFTTRQVAHGDGWMWDQVGPALRDALDEQTGRAFWTGDGRRVYHYTSEDVGRASGHLPNIVYAPAMTIKERGGWWTRLVEHGFNKVISPSIDAIVRRPMAYHNFVEAYRQNSQRFRWLIDKSLIDEAIPRTFGATYRRLGATAARKPEFVSEVRTLSSYTDDAIDALDDEGVIAYLRGIGEEGRKKIRMRVAGDKTIDPTLRRARLKVANEVANMPAAHLDLAIGGIDANVERVRALFNEIESHGVSLKGTYERALRNEDFAKMISERPDLARAFERGGWEMLQKARANLDSIGKRVGEMSVERAIVNTVPFIDSHEIKSQFAQYGKSMLPFWYAEENFYKRWARTLILNPEAIRKGQLTYAGLRQIGIVRTDANGQDFFVMPGSGVLADALSRAPFGSTVAATVGSAFQMPAGRMLPGFNEDVGRPSFSPLVTLPMSAVQGLFPEMRPIRQAVVGKNQINRDFISQVVPTQFANFYNALFSDQSDVVYANSMMAAFAMLEAQGKTPEAGTDPDKIDDWLRDLRGHTRSMMVTKALLGFVSPATPQEYATGDTGFLGLGSQDPASLVHDEFLYLIRYLGIDEGTQAFLLNHPPGPESLVNPLALTVGKSKSASGAPLPATAQAVQFYQDNKDWMGQFDFGGPWLLPPDQSGGTASSRDAYVQQSIDGLRFRQTPTDFMRSIKFKEGATEYFRQRDTYQLQRSEADRRGDVDQVRSLDQQWAVWSKSYQTMHPVFAEELTSGDGRVRRGKTIADLRIAVQDPEGPRPWHFDGVKRAVELFDEYKARLSDLQVSRSARNQEAADALKVRYSAIMDRMIFEHPELESLWTSVLRPEAALG